MIRMPNPWLTISTNTHSRALLTVLVALTLTTLSACAASAHYREHQDAESFFAALNQEIKPGDSIERVQQLLGPGVTPPDKAMVIAATRKLADQNPARVPDGVRDTDEFLGYRYGKRSIGFLQFRSGKLVNFSPKDYAGLAD